MITVKHGTITPKLAQTWLGRTPETTNFRPKRIHRINTMADDMTANRWTESPDAITLNSKGEVTNGQHRLHACILSGVSFKAIIMKGVDNAVNFDKGSPRSLIDSLRAQGEPNYVPLGSALTALYRYRQFANFYPHYSTPYSTGGNSQMGYPSTGRLLEMLAKFPTIHRSVAQCIRGSVIGKLSVSIVTHFVGSITDVDAADVFIERLMSGENLNERDSIFHLRNRIIANKLGKRQLRPEDFHALYIKAWNAWVQGQGMSRLAYRSSGLNPEEFPLMVDSRGVVISPGGE